MGPIVHQQPDLPPSQNLENFHQGNKVFSTEYDTRTKKPMPSFLRDTKTNVFGFGSSSPQTVFVEPQQTLVFHLGGFQQKGTPSFLPSTPVNCIAVSMRTMH